MPADGYSMVVYGSDHAPSAPEDVDLLCAAIRRLAAERNKARRDLREVQRQRDDQEFFGQGRNEQKFLNYLTFGMTPDDQRRFLAYRVVRLRQYRDAFDEFSVVKEFQATGSVIRHLGARTTSA